MRLKNVLGWLSLAFLWLFACTLWFGMMLPPWIDIPSRPSVHNPGPPLLSTRDLTVTVGQKR